MNGAEKARNVYGRNLIARESDGEKAIYRYNGHGDVITIMGTDGTAISSYEYDEFGNETASTGTFDNPYRYAGYEYLDEVELYDLNARYYDPSIARFLTEDPYYNLGNRVMGVYEINVPNVYSIMQANALYAYCGNNPIFFHDLTGYRRKPSVKRITESIETRANEHYKHNIELSFTGYIDNQYRGNAAKVKMGNPKFGSNACGWIAVYNSMLTLDEDVKVADIVMFYDSNPTKYMLMDGAFGIKPSSFDVLFGNYGYNSNTIYFNTDDLDAKAQNADTAILCYFYYTEGVGAHYINLTWNSELDEYVVYNENGGNLKSINDFLEDNDYVFISLTTVEKEEENE